MFSNRNTHDLLKLSQTLSRINTLNQLNKSIVAASKLVPKIYILDLCNKVLTLGRPKSKSILVALLNLWYPKSYFMHLL